MRLADWRESVDRLARAGSKHDRDCAAPMTNEFQRRVHHGTGWVAQRLVEKDMISFGLDGRTSCDVPDLSASYATDDGHLTSSLARLCARERHCDCSRVGVGCTPPKPCSPLTRLFASLEAT